MLPNGYWTVPPNITPGDRDEFRKRVNEIIASGKPLVTRAGVEFHPFPQPAPAMVTPDAFCRYCGSANLRVTFECLKCGAPFVRNQ